MSTFLIFIGCIAGGTLAIQFMAYLGSTKK